MGRKWLSVTAMSVLATVAGCGGTEPSRSSVTPTASPNPAGSPAEPAAKGRRVHLVGFDASEPLVNALKAKKLDGLIVQNPLLMGELGVKTLVEHLQGKTVEPQKNTGETLVTPENLSEPAIAALVNPPKAPNVQDSASGAKTRSYRVFVIPKGKTHEFWQTIHAGAKKGAEALGNVEIVWQGPQKEDDRLQQIQLVQNAIAAQVDGIVLAPLDSRALVKPVEEAASKGIPVVIIDSSLESKAIASYVATDNTRGGVLAARRLGELLKGEGKVILLRYAVGSASTEQREKGFTETLAKEFPKVILLSDTEYAGPTPESAQQKAQSLMTRFRGQANGIFCPNESSCVGMLRALEAAGMVGK